MKQIDELLQGILETGNELSTHYSLPLQPAELHSLEKMNSQLSERLAAILETAISDGPEIIIPNDEKDHLMDLIDIQSQVLELLEHHDLLSYHGDN